MKIDFIENIPEEYSESPILISGGISTEFYWKQFLSLTKEDGRLNIYEIRYEYNCSPFKEVKLLDNVIVIGHDKHCYLFDIESVTQVLILKLSGYFESIYLDDELIYVADAGGLYCLNKDGTWEYSARGN